MQITSVPIAILLITACSNNAAKTDNTKDTGQQTIPDALLQSIMQ